MAFSHEFLIQWPGTAYPFRKPRRLFECEHSVMSLMGTTILCVTIMAASVHGDSGHQSCNAEAGNMSGPPVFRECRLQYYVQVLVGDVSLNQNFLPDLTTSYSRPFGHGELFAFNATTGPERDSKQVGFVRGFTINSAYRASDVNDLIQIELISYNDGQYVGTIQIQGEIAITTPAGSPDELAIVGGTGSFRGARGFDFLSRLLLDGNYCLFHHDLHFLY